MKRLGIDVWSDIACPWCYVGKRRLERALEQFPHRDAVAVRWRAFELDPGAPRVKDASVPYAARLAGKYRVPVADAERMIRQMTEVAARDGLDLRFDRIRPGNTFDAHRVLHLAAERGAQDAAKERFLAGYLCEGEAIGEPSVVARLATEAGLDPDEVAAVLGSEARAAAVRADEAEAHTLGIGGVPCFVLGRRYAVSGAQPADLLLRALERAWTDAAEEVVDGGPVCGPEGCA